MITNFLKNRRSDFLPALPSEEMEDRFGNPYEPWYPDDGQTLGMLGSGMFVTTALLFGLRSFEGHGELFGALGRVAADPLQAAADFLQRGRGFLMRGDVGAREATESALVNRAIRQYEQIKAATGVPSRAARSARIREMQAIDLNRAIVVSGNRVERQTAYLARAQRSFQQRTWNVSSIVEQIGADRVQRWLDDAAEAGRTDAQLARMVSRRTPFGSATALTGLTFGGRELTEVEVAAFIRQRLIKNVAEADVLPLLRRHLKGFTITQFGPALTGRLKRLDDLDLSTLMRAFMERSMQASAPDKAHSLMRTLRGSISPRQFDRVLQEAYALYRTKSYGAGIAQAASRDEILQMASRDPRLFRLVRDSIEKSIAPRRRRAVIPEFEPKGVFGPQPMVSFANEFANRTINPTTAQLNEVLNPLPNGRPFTHLWRQAATLAEQSHATWSSEQKSVINRLVERVRTNLRGAVDRARQQGINLESHVDVVEVSPGHRALEIRFRRQSKATGQWQEGKTYVPLASEQGTYHTPGTSRPFAGKLTMLDEPSILFRHDALFTELISDRGAPIVNEGELALMRLLQLVPKIENDFHVDDLRQVFRFINRTVISPYFKEKALVGSSVGDAINHAAQIVPQISVLMAEVADNPRRRMQLERSLRAAERAKRLFATGSRYFSVDTEFVAPDISSEVGIRPGRGGEAGRIPYQFGGYVMEMDANGPRIKATIGILPQAIEYSEEEYKHMSVKMRAAIKDSHEKTKQAFTLFQERHVGRTEAETQEFLEQIRKGKLSVTLLEGNRPLAFNFTADGPDAATATLLQDNRYSWMRRRSTESFDDFYARVQRELLQRTNTRFSVGHNIQGAEYGIFKHLYERLQTELPSVFQQDSMVDTLDLARLFDINRIHSASLESSVASLFDLPTDLYGLALKELIPQLQDPNRTSFTIQPNRGVFQYLKRAPQHREALHRFYNEMYTNRHLLPEGLSHHDASLDAFMTGKYVAHKLSQDVMTPEGDRVIQMTRDALRATQQVGGRLDMVDAYGGVRYADAGEAHSFYMPLANQMGSSWGVASAVNPGILFFGRLQNPARQLYQRIKPRSLRVSESSIARLGSSKFWDEWRVTTPDGVGKGAYIPVRKPGSAEWQYVDPIIGMGPGRVTQNQLHLYGGWEGIKNYAIDTITAYMPESHWMVSGSRGQATADIHRIQANGMNMRSSNLRITNMAHLDEGMDEFIQRELVKINNEYLAKRGAVLAEGTEKTRVVNLLREIHRLKGLRQSDQVFRSAELDAILDMTIAHRRNEIFGTADSLDAHIDRLLSKSRKDKKTRLHVGRGKAHLTPRGGNLFITSGLERITPDDAIGIGVQFLDKLDAEGQGYTELQMIWADDPRNINKTLAGDTVKTYITAAMRTKDLGVFGEQVMVGAGFMKLKRKDFAGFIQIQLDRLKLRVTNQLQLLDVGDELGRARVLNVAAEAFKEMTGSTDSLATIQRKHFHLDAGSRRLQLVLDAPLMRQAEEQFSLARVMNSMKLLGVTNDLVADETVEVAQKAGLPVPRAKVATLQKESLEELVENLVQTRAELVKTGAARRLVDGVDDTIRMVNRSISETKLFGDLGALFDVHVDAKDQTLTPYFRALSSVANMAQAETTSSQFGQQFEGQMGAVVKSNRLSNLSTALLSYASAQTMDGPSLMAQELSDAWLATQSGLMSFDKTRLQAEIAQELARLGIDDPDAFRNVRWDSNQQAWLYRGAQGDVRLRVNPFTRATELYRHQAALEKILTGGHLRRLQTISGVDIASEARSATLSVNGALGTKYTLAGLAEQYGVDGRARTMLLSKGVIEKELTPEMIASQKVGRELHLKDFESIRQAIPFLSDKYDHLHVDIFEGITDERLTLARKVLKEQGGFSSSVISSILGGDELLMQAALNEAHTASEARALEAAVMTMRGGAPSAGRMLLVEQGMGFPLRQQMTILPDGSVKISLTKGIASLFEHTKEIETVNEAVRSISELAARHSANPTAETLAQLKAQMNTIMSDSHISAAFERVRTLYAANIESAISGIAMGFREGVASFTGGQYKILSNQTDMVKGLQELARLHGSDDLFKDAVQGMLRQQGFAGDQLVKYTDEATRSLRSYVGGQLEQYGDDIFKWHGFAAGEGFMGRKAAERALSEMKSYVDVTTGDRLAQVKSEISHVKKAIEQPGRSTVMGITMRQPDFTGMVGYETSHMTVWADEALVAFGKNPHAVAVYGNPLSLWQFRGDFDGDLLFQTIVNNPMQAALQRQTRAQDMSEYLHTMSRVLDSASWKGEASMRVIKDASGRSRAVLSPSEALQSRSLFGKSIAGRFGAEGLALSLTEVGRGARDAQRVQQAVIGSLGSYSKRGAVEVRQMQSSYLDIVDNLIEASKTSAGVREGVGNDLLERMASTAGALRKETSTAFNMVERAMLFQNEVLQRVGIEKHRGENPLTTARRMREIQHALFGGKSAQYASFDDAFDAMVDFMGEKDTAQWFLRRSTLEANAPITAAVERDALSDFRRASRLVYDMFRQKGEAAAKGVFGSYGLTTANMSLADVEASMKIIGADPEAMRQAGFGGTEHSVTAALSEIVKRSAPSAAQMDASMIHLLDVDHTIDMTPSLKTRITGLIDGMSPNGRIAAGVAAGAMLLALASGGPEPLGESEFFDTPPDVPYPQPRYPHGSPASTRRMLELRRRSDIDARYAMLPQGRIGRLYGRNSGPTSHTSR